MPVTRAGIRTINFSKVVTLGLTALLLVLAGWPSPAAAQSKETSVAANATPSQARITQAIDEKQLLRLKGNVHPLAQARFDQGAVADSQPVDRMLLLLQRSDEQEVALRQLLEDQLTLDSPKHHAWLTPEEFGARFGPADADIQATTAWLNAKGFYGIKVGPGRTTIEFSGNAGHVRDAFHTEIHQYVVKGAPHFANVSDPQIPAALSPVVAGVVSLHNFPRLAHSHSIGKFQRARDGGAVAPLFSFSGCDSSTGGQCNGLGPADLAKIYNIPPSLDGTGQTIAVVGQSNINLADAQEYRAMFGLPVNDPVIILNGPDPGLQPDEAEADLDVQVSGGVAPKAAIKLVVSETPTTGATGGVDLSALYIIDNNIAGVMSESYGACESALGATGNAFYKAMWEQASAQGITVLVSTGDSGSAGCDNPNSEEFAANGLAISGIASTPFNVAVGGTDFSYTVASPSSVYWNTTNGGTPPTESAKSYIPESTWNDTCAAVIPNTCTAATINANSSNPIDVVAASGGPSSIYTKPAWQSGITGMPADSKRDIPDISLFASNGENNSFYIVCQKDFTGANSCDLSTPFQNFEGAGGTSASVQAFAGIMALINQSQATVSVPAPRQGNANYVLYKLYKKPSPGICTSNPAAASASGCVFYDVIKGNISVACKGGTPNCSNTSTAANQYGVVGTAVLPSFTTTAGYDLATGLGTVNVANLAAAWATAGLTSTTTTITASPSGTIAHGSNAGFTVTVAGSGGTPAGQVSLIASPAGAAQTGIGPFTLASGTATFTTNMLPGGTAYNVVAHYSGDGAFAQSDSAPVTVTVSKESSKTFVSLVTFDPNTGGIASNNAATAAYGSPYIMRIDVTNASSTPCSDNSDSGNIPPVDTIPCPTGNVAVTDNGAPLNDFLNSNTGVSSNIVPLNRHGFFEDQPIQLPAGNHSIVAAYVGDNSYTASTSPADALTITLAGTTITVSGPTNATTTQQVTITATIATNSSGVGPTGTVTFISGTSTLGTASVVGVAANLGTGTPATGTAQLVATFTTTGTKSITATYSGDANYSPSGPSAPFSVNVTGSTTGTFTLAGSPVTVTAGATGLSTITVTPTGGFTGNVQVTCAGTGLPPGVTCTPSPLTIAVTGAAPATGQLTVAVAAPSTSMTASRIADDQRVVYAALTPIRPRRANTRGPHGWWTLSAGAGFAAMLLFLFPGLRGRNQLRAAFGLALLCVLSFTLGCGGGSGGGGGVVATHTSISVTATKLPSTANNFAFTVTVTASGATPTGQVQLFDGTTALGLPAPVSNGTVSITTGLGAVGTHSVTAHYLGTSTTQASASGALNLTVTGATTLPLTTSPAGSASVNLTIQ
ncbi:MAG: Ig-like domain repeat protein [Acidobacteriota bacterium]|nr:Ig-like domain repeat protein [Acidobacteriota bacterium]